MSAEVTTAPSLTTASPWASHGLAIVATRHLTRTEPGVSLPPLSPPPLLGVGVMRVHSTILAGEGSPEATPWMKDQEAQKVGSNARAKRNGRYIVDAGDLWPARRFEKGSFEAAEVGLARHDGPRRKLLHTGAA